MMSYYDGFEEREDKLEENKNDLKRTLQKRILDNIMQFNKIWTVAISLLALTASILLPLWFKCNQDANNKETKEQFYKINFVQYRPIVSISDIPIFTGINFIPTDTGHLTNNLYSSHTF